TLFSLPGGDVRVAIGAEHYDINIKTSQLRGRLGAQTATALDRNRDVTSAYGEVLLPIFGDGNATPGFERLDLSIAGRYDRYSDVGSTFNPKFGVNWRPTKDVKLHASYGTSFRAPGLSPELRSA